MATKKDNIKLTNREWMKEYVTSNPNDVQAKDVLAKGGFDVNNVLSQPQYDGLKQRFLNWTLPFFLNQITGFHVTDPFKRVRLGEEYDTVGQAILQRLAIGTVKGVTPGYVELGQGDSLDMFEVNKVPGAERFFVADVNFQAWITIQDESLMQLAFSTNYGVSEVVTQQMERLRAAYALSMYEAKMEALSEGLTSKGMNTLQESQVKTLEFDINQPTDEELDSFILSLNDIATEFETRPLLGKYNAVGYESGAYVDEHVVIVRAGLKNRLSMRLATVFNDEKLNIRFEVGELEHFGGLTPILADGTPLFSVYNKNGSPIGFATTDGLVGEDKVEYPSNSPEVTWDDPHAETFAILAHRGWLFTSTEANLTVTPSPYNPRGMYTNFFCNAPNGHVHIDPAYNMIKFNAADSKKG